MKEVSKFRSSRPLVIISLLILATISSSLKPSYVSAEASYTISISVDPSSGETGDSFTVTATVSISGLNSGTAYVIMKTIAPDGTYSYYASSAQDVSPYRQWDPEDMPVSMKYSWTITAEEEGTYTSTIEIIIDGDVPEGFLRDSKSVTFEASSSSSSSTSGSIDVSVSPSSVQRGESVSISVTIDGYLPPNPKIITHVYSPGSSNPVKTYYGTGTFTYSVPSDGAIGTWKVSSFVKDQLGNVAASDSETFKVVDNTPRSSDSQSSDVPRLWMTVTPNPADVGDVVRVRIHCWYPQDEYYPPNPLQIKVGNSDWVDVSGEFKFTPTSSGALKIWVKGYFDKRSLPGHNFGVWRDNFTTIFVRRAVMLILEYPKRVHVGDTINITVKLMCGDKELQGKQIRVFVDEGEFSVSSGQTILILAKRPGTIDVSALFEGDQEYSSTKNGGGLIEVWTKPVLRTAIGAKA